MTRKLIGAALAAILALVVWGFWLEPASLRTRTYVLELDGLPSGLENLRSALLADLHTGSPFNGASKLARVVERTNEARPDVVLLAGDFVMQRSMAGGTFVAPEETAALLAGLRAHLGVYAVLGNHDRWFDAHRVETALEEAGIEVLEDRAVRVGEGRRAFWVAGVSDYWTGDHDVGRALPNTDPAAPVLVLTHNPDVFPEIPRRVLLTLAAHTHGGQVYVPLLGRPVVPSMYGERYALGHIVEDGRHLFVTPGIGTSILPLRFLVPPEISVLELVAGR